jgi:2-dehydropantoate 2-reductase
LVLIGLKTTANDQLARLLPPLVREHTLCLTLQNGLGNEEQLASLVDPTQIMGGLCFVCLNRVAPGEIHHIDHGNIVLGEFQRPSSQRTRELALRFERVGVACAVTEDLARAHWEKLVWNIPFNGLGVAGSAGYEAVLLGEIDKSQPLGPSLTTDMLLADARWLELVAALMREVIQSAQVLGHALEDQLANDMIRKTRSMGAYKASTLIDYENQRPLEIDGLFREPWRRASQAGVSIPRLTALCRLLEQLDPGQKAIQD